MSILDTARAEALFASTIQLSETHSASEIRAAIRAAIRRLGVRGCALQVAGEFGDYPEVAARRMIWAITTVRITYHCPVPTCRRSSVLPGPRRALAGR